LLVIRSFYDKINAIMIVNILAENVLCIDNSLLMYFSSSTYSLAVSTCPVWSAVARCLLFRWQKRSENSTILLLDVEARSSLTITFRWSKD